MGTVYLTVRKLGGSGMSFPLCAPAALLAGSTAARNVAKGEQSFKNDFGKLDIAASSDGTSKATYTNLSGLPIPITFVLSKQQADQLTQSLPTSSDAVAAFLEQMGLNKEAIASLQSMGVTEFKKDGSEITLKFKGNEPVKATHFMGVLTSTNPADSAVRRFCQDMLAVILKMPMEVREEAVKQFVKTIEENRAKDIENLKLMAKQAQTKLLEKKLEEGIKNKKLLDLITAIRNGKPLTSDQLQEGFTLLKNEGLTISEDVRKLLINELIINEGQERQNLEKQYVVANRTVKESVLSQQYLLLRQMQPA